MRFLAHGPMGTEIAPGIGTALVPPITRTYAGWSSRGQVVGQPGTQRIPMPNPAAVENSGSALASTGFHRSVDSPPYFLPCLYWEADTDKEKFPGSVFSDNQMPVPANRAPNVIKASPYLTRLGGQRQVYQPQVVQRWRGMKGTLNG